MITLHLTATGDAGLHVGVKFEIQDEGALRAALQQATPLLLAQARTGEVYLNTLDWKIGVAKVQRTEGGKQMNNGKQARMRMRMNREDEQA